MQDYVLSLPLLTEKEVVAILSHIVVLVRYNRRSVGEMAIPRIWSVYINRITITIQIPKSGNRNRTPLRIVVTITIEIGRTSVQIFVKIKLPEPAQTEL